MQRFFYILLTISIFARADESVKYEISPELKSKAEIHLRKGPDFKYKKHPAPNSKALFEGIQVGERSSKMPEKDLNLLLEVTKKVAEKNELKGKQGFVVTHILQGVGLTKDRIISPMSRDLGKPLIDNGFEKLETSPEAAPAGSVIVLKGESPDHPGSVYIVGDDGHYYSDSKIAKLPANREVTGIYYKVKGSSDVLSNDSEEYKKQISKRLSSLQNALKMKL